jgi:hypothetical protein
MVSATTDDTKNGLSSDTKNGFLYLVDAKRWERVGPSQNIWEEERHRKTLHAKPLMRPLAGLCESTSGPLLEAVGALSDDDHGRLNKKLYIGPVYIIRIHHLWQPISLKDYWYSFRTVWY